MTNESENRMTAEETIKRIAIVGGVAIVGMLAIAGTIASIKSVTDDDPLNTATEIEEPAATIEEEEAPVLEPIEPVVTDAPPPAPVETAPPGTEFCGRTYSQDYSLSSLEPVDSVEYCTVFNNALDLDVAGDPGVCDEFVLNADYDIATVYQETTGGTWSEAVGFIDALWVGCLG